MPNNVTLIGLFLREYGDDDESALPDLTPLVDANLCKIVLPLPEELQGIVAASPRYRMRHKATGEFSRDSNGCAWEDREQYEKVLLTDDEAVSLHRRFGCCDWYEWQSQNWGTKWGTYGTKVHELGGDCAPIMIECVTAWSAPNETTMSKINAHLFSTYCLKNIRWIAVDPYDNSIHDIDVGVACLTQSETAGPTTEPAS